MIGVLLCYRRFHVTGLTCICFVLLRNGFNDAIMYSADTSRLFCRV
jgi:hypothetical protein